MDVAELTVPAVRESSLTTTPLLDSQHGGLPPRYFLVRIQAGREPASAVSIHPEGRGYHLQQFASSDAGVVFASDYPLPDLGSLWRSVQERGISALDGMPDNTVCVGFSRKRDGSPVLWAARDKVGNTPLYVSSYGGSFCAGSALSLLKDRLPQSAFAIDPKALPEYLLFRYTSGPHTLVSSVKSPLAGHALVYPAAGAPEHVRYWDIRQTFTPPRPLDVDTVTRLRRLIAENLEREASPGIGLMFSGGLDSCYLAYQWNQLGLGEHLKLLTMAFPGVGQDDLLAAREHAQALRLPFQPIEVERRDFAARLPRAVEHFGWPVDHPNFVGRDLLFAAAAEAGIDRLLAGEGSDTVFGGAWYVSLLKFVRLKESVPRWLAPLLPPVTRRARQIARVLNTPLEELVIYDKTYYSQQAALSMAANRSSEDCVAHLRAVLHDFGDGDPIDAAFYLAYLTTLSVYPAAQRSMACALGVDIGYPFLEQRVVELANSVPGRTKLQGFTAKCLLKAAADGVLPESAIRRRKYGLPIPMEEFVTAADGLRVYADLIRDRNGCSAAMLDHAQVLKSVDRVLDGTYSRDDLELYWVLVNFEIWARIYLRGERL